MNCEHVTASRQDQFLAWSVFVDMNLSSIGILVKRRSIFLFVCGVFFATVKEPWHQYIIICQWPDLRGSAVARPCLYSLWVPTWDSVGSGMSMSKKIMYPLLFSQGCDRWTHCPQKDNKDILSLPSSSLGSSAAVTCVMRAFVRLSAG